MKTLNLKRAAFAAALVLLPLFAAAKQPLTHETMWLMKRVGAPVVSPDGKWVVFSVVDPSYDEKEQSTDLWLVPADGSAAGKKAGARTPGITESFCITSGWIWKMVRLRSLHGLTSLPPKPCVGKVSWKL